MTELIWVEPNDPKAGETITIHWDGATPVVLTVTIDGVRTSVPIGDEGYSTFEIPEGTTGLLMQIKDPGNIATIHKMLE